MNLTERLLLLSVFPQSGSIEDAILAKSVQKKIELTPEEIQEYEFKSIPDGKGNMTFVSNEKGATSNKYLEFIEVEEKFLGKILKDASSKKLLPFSLVDLYQKYVK